MSAWRSVRVGLVMHGLDRPLTGVTRVALELARALQRSGACDVTLLSTAHDGFLEHGEHDVRYLPGCARVPGLMVLGGPVIAVAARRLRLDLVHDPVGVSPFTLGRWAGRFKRMLTIHDAIAFRYPQGYSWSNNFLHRRFVPATLRNVDQVITVSEHAREDLGRFLGLDPQRVSVVPNGVSGRFRPVDPEEAQAVARRHGLGRPYVLYVGATQARKNVAGLVTAFQRLHAELPSYQLVLAGPRGPGEASLLGLIADLGLRDDVSLVGPVPESELPALYSAASLFVFPSFFEGFGLPVLEAMACGTPVVCSGATSLPEVAGDAALLVDPADTDALGQAMYRVLIDPSLAASLRQAGLRRAAAFTWERTAERTVEVYERVLSRA